VESELLDREKSEEERFIERKEHRGKVY